MKNLLLILIFFTTVTTAIAQPAWHYTNTGVNHTILVQGTTPITVSGQQIVNGDYIGVFFDSLGTLACAGYAVWTGSTTAVTAWGADALSGGHNGFAANEEFKWKIWKQQGNLTYNATATYVPFGFPNTSQYNTNGMSGLMSLTGILGTDLALGNLLAPLTGCSGLGSSETISFQILNLGNTIVSSFSVSYSINGGSVFTETINAPVNPGATYAFVSSASHNLSAQGSYSVSASVSVSNDVTPANNATTLTINNLPGQQAVFTMTDTSYCAGPSTLVELTASPAGGIFTASNIQISGVNGAYYANFTQPGVFTITYQYTDANNCYSSDSQQFTVISSPTLELGSVNPFCAGDSFIINPTGNYTSYLWSTGSTASSLTVTQTGVYAVTVMNTDGCQMSDNINVTFNALPVVVITGDLHLCEGTLGALTVNNTNSTFLWSTGVINNTTSIDTAGVYSVTVTTSGCSNSDTVTVVEVQNPDIPTGTEVSGCEGTPLTLGAGVWLAYQWSTGATTPTIQVTQEGSYSVTIYNQYLCHSSYTIGAYFEPLAISEFTYVVNGSTVSFTNISQNEWTNSYVWNFGDGGTSSDPNPSHSYAATGVYPVSLTVQNNCGADTYTLNITISVGIDEETSFDSFSIYPNPASDNLLFVSPASASGWTATILDLTGQTIQSIHALTPGKEVQLSLTNLAQGAYFLILRNEDNETIRRPFIKK